MGIRNLRNRILPVTGIILTSLLLTSCGVSTPEGKRGLLREAEQAAYGPVEEVRFITHEGDGDFDCYNKLIAEDEEYGLEFYVMSEITRVAGLDGTTMFNIFTGKPMHQRSESNDFFLQYMTYFFDEYEDEIEDLEEEYGVDITYNGLSTHANYFIEVYECSNLSDSREVFDELRDCLEDYDNRGYFQSIEEANETYGNMGFRIAFFSCTAEQGGSSNDFTKIYDLDPEDWDNANVEKRNHDKATDKVLGMVGVIIANLIIPVTALVFDIIWIRGMVKKTRPAFGPWGITSIILSFLGLFNLLMIAVLAIVYLT